MIHTHKIREFSYIQNSLAAIFPFLICIKMCKNNSNSGDKKSGDMIPWVVSEQFRQYDFGELSGGRIVRIATHPDFQRAGYGRQALKGEVSDQWFSLCNYP